MHLKVLLLIHNIQNIVNLVELQLEVHRRENRM